MRELTEEETRAFGAAMYQKIERGWGWQIHPSVGKEVLEEIILNVIVDTELVITEKVPLEAWTTAEQPA